MTTQNKSKNSAWKHWVELMADVCWEEHGGTWARKAQDGSWYVIRFENMAEHLGEQELKESGIDRYEASLKRVDFSEIPSSEIEAAIRSCGPDQDWLQEQPAETTEMVMVWSLVSYGLGQPLSEHTDPSYPNRAMAAARRSAEEFIADSESLESALERPVNKIGSTAREFGRGDIHSAMERARDAPPADWLPYAMGYLDARAGKDREDGDDVVAEYHQGYDRGSRVNNGEADPPSWIQEGKSASIMHP